MAALSNQELTDKVNAIIKQLNKFQTVILNLANKKQMTAFSLLMQRNIQDLEQRIETLEQEVELLKKQQ